MISISRYDLNIFDIVVKRLLSLYFSSMKNLSNCVLLTCWQVITESLKFL